MIKEAIIKIVNKGRGDEPDAERSVSGGPVHKERKG